VSATANALIGGDLYEAVSTPHGVRIIIGDVRGKGLDAVQLAATVLGAFRQAAAVQPDLPSLVKAIDAVVSAVTGDEDFVTALLCRSPTTGAYGWSAADTTRRCSSRRTERRPRWTPGLRRHR
jgi:serine phosphatase RsbU (regulator of sigma subunit)